MVATSTACMELRCVKFLKQMSRPYAAVSTQGAFMQARAVGGRASECGGSRSMTSCFVAPLWDGLAIAHVLVRLP